MLTRPDPIAAEAIPTALFPAISAIAGVARELSSVIARGPLGGALGRETGTNADGDGQTDRPQDRGG